MSNNLSVDDFIKTYDKNYQNALFGLGTASSKEDEILKDKIKSLYNHCLLILANLFFKFSEEERESIIKLSDHKRTLQNRNNVGKQTVLDILS